MHPSLGVDHTNSYKPQAMAASMDIFSSQKSEHWEPIMQL